MTAGLLNIALALVVWVLVEDSTRSPAHAPQLGASRASRDGDALATLFFFAAAAVTGASSFIYEIGWIRMLSLVLGSTTHSFELMLSAFITGLAFGGLVDQAAHRSHRRSRCRFCGLGPGADGRARAAHAAAVRAHVRLDGGDAERAAAQRRRLHAVHCCSATASRLSSWCRPRFSRA